jgi:NAD(P)-dependent dehydrogenase (short-subunit alcohol dehydrogenase family)
MQLATANPGIIMKPDLRGTIALVAGATRGTGRGIARALGEAGATVYCTGRSIRGAGATPGRPETIEETAELVTAAGGIGIAVRVDHTAPEQVRALVERIRAEHGGLDILVNDVWGGDDLTEWGKTLWEHSLENGLAMQRTAVHSHIITSHAAIPIMLDRPGALIFEITDGVEDQYRGNLFYDLAKMSVIRLAVALAYELRTRSVTAVAVTPGFLRSERMLALFGVTEENWRDQIKRDPNFAESETPLYVGRGIAALAADPEHWRVSGRALTSWDLAERYDVEDADGRRPHWGRYIGGQTDALWSKLVDATRSYFAIHAPSVAVAADRASRTLRAGDATRVVLSPELFMGRPRADRGGALSHVISSHLPVNQPSGNPTPSPDAARLTIRLAHAADHPEPVAMKLSGHRTRSVFDIVLVGHSFGGYVTSGVADRVPDRERAIAIS